tara:strand:+ start:28456 stop:29913 length:1458 start_codon:yes stop_codon:yes gene_type:complete
MIAIGLIQIAILLFSLLRAKGLALMLGPEGVGVIGTMDQLVVTVTQVAAFGIPIAAMKFMSAAHSTGQDAFRDCYAAFVRIIIGLALLVTALGITVLLFAPDVLPALADHSEVLVASLLSVPPMMLTILIAHTLASAQMARTAAIYNLCFVSGVAMAGLTGAWFSGLEGFYYGAAAAGATTVLCGMAWLWRSLGLSVLRRGVSIRKELTMRPKVFSTALTASISLVSLSATMLLIRYVVLDRLGEEQTGYLQAAIALALSIGSVLGTINALQLAPSMNRSQPNAERFQLAADFANRVALLMVAGAVPLALFPGLGLTVLFSSEFIPASMALILCLIWQVGHQLRATCLQLLIGTDHPLSGALASVLALGVTIGTLSLLVGSLGILAAPAALIAGDIIAIILMLARLTTSVAMPVPWEVLARFIATSAAILTAGLLFDPGILLPDIAGLAMRLLYMMGAFGLIWITMPAYLSPTAAVAWLRDRRSH